MKECKNCKSSRLKILYTAEYLPLFQNKVFKSEDEARRQDVVSIRLVQCNKCGFVFNLDFDNSRMQYDDTYQNEQNYSKVFVEHLQSVADLLIKEGFKDKIVVEIGCGKGFFTELLEKNGFKNVKGFDPAYEGNNKNIIKDYFGDKYKSLEADLVILRHVLEHIDKPFEFLSNIKKACPPHAIILIEVPLFEWIIDNNAFWDIFHEHCNYFDKHFLSSFFEKSIIHTVFEGQYGLLLGNLSTLRLPCSQVKYPSNIFKSTIDKVKSFLVHNEKNIIWGAASKAVTLLNLIDRDKKLVKYLIDINPKKQNKFIANYGHPVYGPELLQNSREKERVMIVNQNYYNEIVEGFANQDNVEFFSLEKIIKE